MIATNASVKYVGWLLFLTTAVYMLIIPLFMQGMFLAGTQYSVVAKNLAEGAGSFWEPYLGERWALHGKTAFLEHPPLGYYLQSLSFEIGGNSYLSERFFLLAFWLISGGLIIGIWREISGEKATMAWLPLLFWMSIGTVGWSFQNNVLEVQVALFSLLAIWLILRGFRSQNIAKSLIYAVAAGLAICAGTLVKGVPALFPLVAPAGLLFLDRKKSVWLLHAVVVISFIASLLAVYFSSEMAQQSLQFYLHERLLNRVATQPTVTNNMDIVGDLLLQLLPAIILATLPFLLLKQLPRWKPAQGAFLFFLYIGLSASIPLALTKVQRGFYLLPAYAYFAIAFAVVAASAWQNLLNGLKPKVQHASKTVFIVLIFPGFVATFYFAGIPKRDADLLQDVAELEKILPPKTILFYETGNQDQNFNWPFYMYLVRFSSLDAQIFTPNQRYQIQNISLPEPSKGYQKVKELNTIVLYRAKQ